MAKKDKAKKTDEPEAEKPEAAEGEEGAAPAKKKLAGKTLVLFIILPAVLVLGGGGAAAMMLLGGGGNGEAHEAASGDHGEKKSDDHGKKKDDHGGGATATAAAAEGTTTATDTGHPLPCREGDPCYYVMPNLMVNLANTENTRPQFLKLDLVLESSDAAAFNGVPEAMPRLKDQLNSFLRELRVEDLNGSAGSFRLRRELMKRFNIVMAPAKIDAVLIEGMLIQ